MKLADPLLDVFDFLLGHGFAAQLDTNFAPFFNVVKERAKYETGVSDQGAAEMKRAKTDYTAVPEFDAKVSLMWYPTEFIQFQFGYNAMAFFNTVVSQVPVDFNYGSLTPTYNRVFRYFGGFSASVGFIF